MYTITREQIKRLEDNGFEPECITYAGKQNLLCIRTSHGDLVYSYDLGAECHDSYYIEWCNEYLIENILEYNLECGVHPFPFCFHPKECEDDLDLYIDFIIKVKEKAGV